MHLEVMNMMSTKNILIIQTGPLIYEAQKPFGEYATRFAKIIEPLSVETTICNAFNYKPLPKSSERFDGIILTGSPLYVNDADPWMKETANWVLHAADQHIPILGVCFGHQLLAYALGGVVEKNAAGPEYGTTEVSLTETGTTDALFTGLSTILKTHQYHSDHIVTLPADAIVLAQNTTSPIQAFAYGEHIRGLQWHPEATKESLGAVLEERNISAPVVDVPEGKIILKNWIEYYVKK